MRPPHVRCPISGPRPSLAKQPREAIAAGPAPAIDEHGLRTLVGDDGRLPVVAVAHAPVVRHAASEELDEAIGNLAAGFPAFVNDQARPRELRAELLEKFVLSVGRGIADVDVADSSAAFGVHVAPVGFHPGMLPERCFAIDGLHERLVRALQAGAVIDREDHRAVGEPLKRGPRILRRIDRLPVDGQNPVAFLHLDSRPAQRRAQRIPGGGFENMSDSAGALLQREIASEIAERSRGGGVVDIPAAAIGVRRH